MMETRFVLASKSPRRSELLTRLGLSFEIASGDPPEDVPEGLAPAETVEGLAARKCLSAAGSFPDAAVIAADTVVVLDGAVFGKPRDAADAHRILRALSGRTQTVYSGVAVRSGGELRVGHEMTEVDFRDLTDREIDAYIATGEPFDKAGAWGIQTRGALFVREIRGDYYNVMGLPLTLLLTLLRELGIDLFDCMTPQAAQLTVTDCN